MCILELYNQSREKFKNDGAEIFNRPLNMWIIHAKLLKYSDHYWCNKI